MRIPQIPPLLLQLSLYSPQSPALLPVPAKTLPLAQVNSILFEKREENELKIKFEFLNFCYSLTAVLSVTLGPLIGTTRKRKDVSGDGRPTPMTPSHDGLLPAKVPSLIIK